MKIQPVDIIANDAIFCTYSKNKKNYHQTKMLDGINSFLHKIYIAVFTNVIYPENNTIKQMEKRRSTTVTGFNVT